MKLVLVGDVVLNLEAVAAICFHKHQSTVHLVGNGMNSQIVFQDAPHEQLAKTVRQLVADRVIAVPVPVPQEKP